MSTWSPRYPRYPHSRKPSRGKIIVVLLAVLVAFVCCCSAGMFIAMEPAETARIVKSILGQD